MKEPRIPSPLKLLISVVFIIFTAEILFALILRNIFDVTPLQNAFLEASCLALAVLPALYYFIYRPFISHIEERGKTGEETNRLFSLPLDLICIAGLDGYFKKVNPALMRILDLSEKELLERPIMEFIHPDDRQPTRDEIEEQLKIGGTLNFENRWLCKDGSFKWLTWSAARFLPEGPIYAMVRDTTERKQAEALLREAEERFRAIFQKASDYILVLEPVKDGPPVIIDASDSALEKHGYTREEMIGKPITLLDPDEPPMPDRMAQLMEGKELSFEVEHKRKDGTRFRVEISAKMITVGGKPLLYTIERDITERRKLEGERRLLAEVVEQSYECIIIADPDRVIQYVNPAFEKLLGYSKDEALGRKVDYFRRDDRNFEKQKDLVEAISNGKMWQNVFTYTKKDGQLTELEVTVIPIKDFAGRITNFAGLYRDVSAQMRLLKAKEYFAQTTSHELRTPLAGIQLVNTLLQKFSGQVPEKELVFLENRIKEIYSQFERISSATSIFTDLTSGKPAPFFNIFLRAVFTTVLEEVETKTRFVERKLSIITDFSQLPPDTVISGNEALIRRAFEEVLSNAVKYTPDGKRITITATASAPDAVVVTIADEGVGIERENIDSLFSPFFSIENINHHSTGEFKYLGGGIGLGLTLAKIIVDYHKGEIGLASEGANKGTVVTIRFKRRGDAARELKDE